jgi:hypothetical protein
MFTAIKHDFQKVRFAIMEYMKIIMNTKSEDLKLAKALLREYRKKKDKANIAICLRNIKNFSAPL